MKTRIILASALALAIPHVAVAGESEDFAACDGMKKPRRDADGMRGPADLAEYGRLANNLGNRPQQVIRYCTSVLEGDRIRTHQTLRRAHVLRARAAAFVQTGQADRALADIAEARRQVSDRADDAVFQRSMGLSLDLLEAIALADKGDLQRAASIARTAQASRPYALQIQMVADRILALAEPGTASASNLMQIYPLAREQQIPRLVANADFAAAVALADSSNLIQMPASFTLDDLLLDGGNPDRLLARQLNAVIMRIDVAHALAATGDTPRAQELVDGLRSLQAPGERSSGPERLLHIVLQAEPVAQRLQLADARLAVALGDADGADALLAGTVLGETPRDRELQAALAALRPQSLAADAAEAGPDMAQIVQAVAPAEAVEEANPEAAPAAITEPVNASGLRRLAPALLFTPETARSVIDYELSRPNILGAIVGGALTLGTSLLGGIDRTAGFRSSHNADGSVSVEFTGNTLSGPMVEEMTLLRAAELAHEAQKPFFEVTSREDYMRYQVGRQFGVEISRRPVGYKTQLAVRFLESADDSPHAISTVGVIDALGPFYYEAQ